MLRFLGARRLSRVKDNSTSFERQGAAIEATAAALGGRVVGWADDPDVSASKTAPADRPGLGPWLARHAEYDGIIWWRQDRAVRDMHDLSDLARWAKKNGKRLIFAEGPGGARLELDMTSPVSELIVMVIAFAAQMEAQAIAERTAGATEYLRSVGRWGGGRVPFGRQKVPHPDGEGWWLGRHEPTAALVDDMVDRVLAGQTYHAISRWLNADHPGVTPANHRKALRGAEPDPTARWNPGMISAFLRDPLLRGHKVVRGETVRDEVGEPVLCGDVLVSDDVWHRLQAAMDAREQAPNERRSDLHPLLGVLFCGSCGGRMYQGWLSPGPNRKAPVRQYRCAARAHGRTCRKPAYVVAGAVDAYVKEEFLRRFGDWEVVETITYPGVDHTAEIKELEATVEELATRVAELRGPAADVLMRQLQGRSDRLEKLRLEPVRAPRTEQRATGKLYRQVWAAEDTRGRLDVLLGAGVRVVVGETTRGCRDVVKRLSFEAGQHADPYLARMDEILAEEQG